MSKIASLPVLLLLWSIAASPLVAATQTRINDRTFTLPDGFTIELVAGPPLIDRPIEADFDAQGRLYVSDSSGSRDKVEKQLADRPHRLLRLTDSNGDGTFDQRTIFADHLMFPEGVLCFGESVFVAAPPSIWKLTDTGGDGAADERVEWFNGKTLTGCANDLHGPYAGPDGWIYWCKGAFAEQTYDLGEGRKPLVTRASHVFRSRPDGTGIEPVMTGGMDNPVELVFTPGGERIITATFLQDPAGGRRDGIIHAIYGGVYGKVHNVIENHPRTSPEMMPVLAHLGPAAPCGLARYESDAFGADYTGNLFVTCFNLHKVTRHVLTASGATFTSRDEDFLTCDSLDFHPTDVLEDADGSLLVIDTGGWYKLCCPTSQLHKPDILGAIYRIRRAGAPTIADPRGLRLAWGSLKAHELCRLLDDARPVVRRRAIQMLARQNTGALTAIEQVLHRALPARARLNAVWAATRIDAPGARALARTALLDEDETVRQAAAHSVGLWRDREAMDALVALLENGTPANRRVAAEALGRIGRSKAVPALLEALARDDNDAIVDHSLTFALIEIHHAHATAAGVSSDNPRVRRAALVALDQMEGGGLKPETVAAQLNAPDVALRESANWIVGRHPSWGDALATTLGDQFPHTSASPQDAERLRRQLARLAGGAAIQKLLAERAADAKAPVAERVIALGAMAESTLKAAPQPWVDAIRNALVVDDPAVRDAAVAAAAHLPPPKDKDQAAHDMLAVLAGPLLAIGARADLPPAARLDALAAVPGGASEADEALFSFLLSELKPDVPMRLRLRAVEVLGRTKLTVAQLAALTEAVRLASPLEIGPLLAAFDRSDDAAVGAQLVAALKDAKSLTSLNPGALRQHLAKFPRDVQKDAEALYARVAPDAAEQTAHLEQLLKSLPTGDVRNGQSLFNSAKAACASCHAIGYVGGTVGPDLTRIGQTRSERDLLESIVYPSASFVRSYEPMQVQTKDGDRQYGIVRKDDAGEIVLVTGPNAEVHIARADVKSMTPGTLSVMPAGLEQQLSSQELADLVAFLKASK